MPTTIAKANDYQDFEQITRKTIESNDYLAEIEEKSQYLDVFEIESLREAGVKHFRLEDGTYRAISYGRVVHQKDANGKWQDIDNTLSLNNGFYKTNDGRVSFAQNIDSSIPFYELNKNDFSLSLSVLSNPSNRVVVSIENQNGSLNETNNSIEEMSKIRNNSHISYEGIYNGVNLNFYLEANTVSIMLNINSLFSDNQIKFLLETDNVEAEIDNGCLVLIDPITSYIKYRLFQPYLNNTNEYSFNDYSYGLRTISDGKYEITINLCSKDCDDSDDEQLRIPPGMGPEIVIIDDGGGGGGTAIVYDTYISSSATSTNYVYSSEVRVSANNNEIGLIRINEPSIPVESTIVDAFFAIPYYYPTNTSNYSKVAAYQVLSSWNEYSVTWNSSPSISQTQLGSDYALGGATSTNPSSISLDIASLAKKWYSGESSNYGIACKHISGTATTVLFKSWESYSERATLTFNYNLNSLTISNGTYFIKNGHLDKYVQIDDGDSGNNYNTEGAILELWTGTGVSFQKWIFEYLHNGYYKIKSYRSGKVISVQSGYENTGAHALRQETYNGSYRQQWSISLTSHGMYKIKPRSSENYSIDWVMCCGEGIGGNGRNVEQREYVDNLYYKDEWFLQKLELNYVNHYDSTFVGETSLIDYISTANSFANIVFTRLFNINVVMDGAATQLTDAVADECTHSANVPCSNEDCGFACSNHHKNCFNISNQLYNQSLEDNHRYILWTNRSIGTYCQQNSSGNHETVSWIAVVYNHRPIIHFLIVYGASENVKKACMTLNIIHESAHTFGMNDVYDDEGHDVIGEYNCVMERFETAYAYSYYDDILLGVADPFCSSCLSTIEPLIYDEIMN